MARFIGTSLVALAIKKIYTGGVFLVTESMDLGNLTSYRFVGNDLS